MSISPISQFDATSEEAYATVFDLALTPSARAVQLLATRDVRQARHAYGVSELLRDRHELRGVYAPADLVDEFTRWCA